MSSSPPLRADRVAPEDPELLAFLAAIAAGDVPSVSARLKSRPGLAVSPGADGQTALHLAARHNDPQLAALLVACGADLEARFGDSGHTPLSWAVTCHALECARALLNLGAECDLFCAAGLGSLDHVRACFDETGQLRPGAVRCGSSRFDAAGRRLPCPPATPREQISDALYIASRNAQVEVVRELLERGADPGFPAFMGATPLHWAYFGGSAAVIDLLLQHGADPHLREPALGCTPRAFGICVAVNWGFDFLVRARLADDPRLASLCDGQTSPLHEAARHNRIEIARLLLAAGADPALPDAEGRTPGDVAQQLGHTDLAAILQPPTRPR